jgi:hypothetical protein
MAAWELQWRKPFRILSWNFEGEAGRNPKLGRQEFRTKKEGRKK